MKKLIVMLVIALIVGYLFLGTVPKENIPDVNEHQDTSKYKTVQPLRLVFLQDVSGSIQDNGIELISATIFKPYFDEIHRDIEINFGLINERKSNKFIPVSLPKATFKKPIFPDLHKISTSKQTKYKDKYVHDCKVYEADSILFFEDRAQRIHVFCVAVEAQMDKYRKNLATSTNLYSAVKIADEIFNYSEADSAQNAILINSDGFDTNNRSISKLSNKAAVYLIGANAGSKTSIDSIITKRFAYPHQAIQFTLK